MIRVALGAVVSALMLTVSGDAGSLEPSFALSASVVARFEQRDSSPGPATALRLELRADGHVESEVDGGDQTVTRCWLISQVQVRAVRDLFERARFLSLPADAHCHRAYDGSTTVLFFSSEDRTSPVTLHRPCFSDEAEVVGRLAADFQAMVQPQGTQSPSPPETRSTSPGVLSGR
jgi:hypothetical protein